LSSFFFPFPSSENRWGSRRRAICLHHSARGCIYRHRGPPNRDAHSRHAAAAIRRRVSKYRRTSPGSKRSNRPTYTCGSPDRQRLWTWRTVQRRNAATSSTVQRVSAWGDVSMGISMPLGTRQPAPAGTALNVGSTRQFTRNVRCVQRAHFLSERKSDTCGGFLPLLRIPPTAGAGPRVSLFFRADES
jgi:hypothetical protein